jgi:hypothetical protein
MCYLSYSLSKNIPTNKTLNTANTILMKKKIKVIFQKKNLFYEKLPKFEQHFELVSRIVTLNLLTRKLTDKTQRGKTQIF